MELSLLDGQAGRGRIEFERCIAAGGVVVFPADTVYGLACDPLDEQAVERLERLKGRDEGRPAAVMFFTEAALAEALPDLGPRTREAVRRLLPGPFTLILPNAGGNFPLACGPKAARLGVRMIDGPLAGARCAVMQSSANPSGGTDPRSIEEIDAAIRDHADLVLDGGELPGTPSTVIDLGDFERSGTWLVVREGAARRREVKERLDPIAV